MKYPTAPFQKEIFDITEDPDIKTAVIVAFRGSAKSTIMTLSLPIWSIIGREQKKYILILGHTMHQAKIYMKNIKEELEKNNRLRRDLGPFQEDDEWHSFSVVIPKYNARITCASYEQSIRGVRNRQTRPDLIVCDDVEDLESVKTLEGRDKLHQWLTGEVIPAGDRDTRLFIVGNLLHEDSLIMRLKNSIEEKIFDGIFRAYPLVDDNGKVAWPGKFPTEKEIDTERKKIGSEVAWQREYMLRIVPDENRVIQPNWITYYQTPPPTQRQDFRFAAIGVDLAISKNEKADYTAMVSALVFGRKEDLKIFILPNLVNKRLSSLETQKQIICLSRVIGNGIPLKIFIEDVGYQSSLIEALRGQNIPAEGVKVHGQDKLARLTTGAFLIESGKVRFPSAAADELISQLVNFGFQKHDDLADALAILLHKILEAERATPEGYIPLLEEKELREVYTNHPQHIGQKRLGVVIGGGGREHSVIALRSESAAEILFKDTTSDFELLANKISCLAATHKIPLHQMRIFVDRAGNGRAFCEKLNRYIPKRNFGVDLGAQTLYGEQDFADLYSQSYWRFSKWVKKGGKLVGEPLSGEFAAIHYRMQTESEIKIMSREDLIKEGLPSPDVADALMLTFTMPKMRNVRYVPPPYESISEYDTGDEGPPRSIDYYVRDEDDF